MQLSCDPIAGFVEMANPSGGHALANEVKTPVAGGRKDEGGYQSVLFLPMAILSDGNIDGSNLIALRLSAVRLRSSRQ
jgi:hypothetical protein